VQQDEQTHLVFLCDFTDETLEGKFTNEELGRLLIPSDFTEGDGAGTEAVGAFDPREDGLFGCGFVPSLIQNSILFV